MMVPPQLILSPLSDTEGSFFASRIADGVVLVSSDGISAMDLKSLSPSLSGLCNEDSACRELKLPTEAEKRNMITKNGAAISSTTRGTYRLRNDTQRKIKKIVKNSRCQ